MHEFVARWSNALAGAAGDHRGRVRRKRSGRTGLRGLRGRSRTIGRAYSVRANSPTWATPEHGQPIGRDLGYSAMESSENWAPTVHTVLTLDIQVRPIESTLPVPAWSPTINSQ
eukprot:4778202-Prymnesium_polylepis.1